MTISNIGEREQFVWEWNSLKSMLPSTTETQRNISNDRHNTSHVGLKSWIRQLCGLNDASFLLRK